VYIVLDDRVYGQFTKICSDHNLAQEIDLP
jgi:hypothetical protein